MEEEIRHTTDRGEMSLQELVEYMARGLVNDPSKVEVTAVEKGDMTVYELRVADDDKGRVIGKKGRTAKAIRALVSAAATKDDKKATVEIVD
jgi:predicted RNA-binding protein YlqC (UPF0109 family)